MNPHATAILEYVSKHDFASYVELHRHLDELGLPNRGDHAMEMDSRNVFVWAGMSQEMVSAMIELLDAKLIHHCRCEPLIYLIDGMPLTMPVANGNRTYTKPHWQPATIRPGTASARKTKKKSA